MVLQDGSEKEKITWNARSDETQEKHHLVCHPGKRIGDQWHYIVWKRLSLFVCYYSETYFKWALMILFLNFCCSLVLCMMMKAVFIGKQLPSFILREKGKMEGKKRTANFKFSKQITRYFLSMVQLKAWYVKNTYVVLFYSTLNVLIELKIETMNAVFWYILYCMSFG